MRTEIENAIKDEIQEVFGRPIVSSRDCMELSDEIYEKTKSQLNFNTLRRFFGLVKAEYPASQSTLTILSRYCGFHSTTEVQHVKKAEYHPEKVEATNLLLYLVALFEETPVTGQSDKTFLSLVKQTIKFLHHHLALMDKFQNLIAKTQNGQAVYYEQFVNMNKLNSYYGTGLRYYLNEKRTKDGHIFTYSMWLLKEYLNGNDEKVMEYAGLIKKEQFAPELNLHIACRFHSALLLFSHVSHFPVEEILIDLYKYYSSSFVQTNASGEQLFYFECVVSEALVLTGHYHDALYYLEGAEAHQKKIQYCKYTTSPQNLKLLKAIACYKTGRPDRSIDIFNTIKPSDLFFISNKYYGILYLHLANELKRKHNKYNESLQHLIQETGFVRLANDLP